MAADDTVLEVYSGSASVVAGFTKELIADAVKNGNLETIIASKENRGQTRMALTLHSTL